MKVNKVDFAIITILPDELKAINARFSPKAYKDPSTQNTYGISHVQTKDGKDCVVAIARTYEPGNDASQLLASNMISNLDPQMLLVVGIGGGVPDNDFTLGDVIVSSRIHNFDLNAIKANKTSYDVRGGIHPLISDITANQLYFYQEQFAGWNSVTSIKALRPSLQLTDELLQKLIDPSVDEEWRKKVVNAFRWHFDARQRGARPPIFLTGPIASSNTLVRDDAVLAQWLEDARSIRAVEMEAAGVYQAAQRILQQCPVMAIRGISDIVGFQRDDDWKLYACHAAAAFAYAFVTSGMVEPRKNTVSPGSTPITSVGVPAVQPSQSSQGDIAMPPQNANTIKVFTIYAYADKAHKERLYAQLAAYVWSGMIDLWDEEKIIPSPNLFQEDIDDHIDSSQITLLLVSPQFIGGERCLTNMAHAMQRYTDGKTTIIPIYIRPTDWPEAPFDDLLKLPRNGKPVGTWSSSDEAWHNVALDIRKVCDGLRGRQSNP